MSGVIVEDSRWRKLLAAAHDLDKHHVRVGVFGSSGEHPAEAKKEGEGEKQAISMVELAAIHEFGSPAAGIPARSFIRLVFKVKREEIIALCAKLCKAVVTGKMPVKRAYGLLGAWLKKEIQSLVTSGDQIKPDIKQATKDAKGSDRPLVDTGRLVNAVDYAVEDGPAAQALGV